jgi:uncharacterized protein YukJ
MVALTGYGLLIGKIVESRPPRLGHPHWLLWVQPGAAKHPAYRVAVNLQSSKRGDQPDQQYRIVNFGKRDNALIKKLRHLDPTPQFLTADSEPDLPRLDFVRGGIVDPFKFSELKEGPNPLRSRFEKAVARAAQAGISVAVFGTGYPMDPVSGGSVPTGFTGIENIHMNQGTKNLINGFPHYVENGPNQDGGIIFLFPSGPIGFFVKFASQTTDTDKDGNPAETGIDKIDDTPPHIRKAIMPPIGRRSIAARRSDARTSAKQAARPPASPGDKMRRPASTVSTTNAAPTPNDQDYQFADVNPKDAAGQYIPDNDANTYKTPYVMTRSSGHTRGPVPTPRVYPRLDLATIVGPNPPGYVSNRAGKSIAFDVIGDSARHRRNHSMPTRAR